jgi:hypothetical protein
LKVGDSIAGAKIRCIGRKIGKPILFRYAHDHRALMVFMEGHPVTATVEREWDVKRK